MLFRSTEAIAIVVSQTSGDVRVFQNGKCQLQIHPEQRYHRGTVEMEQDGFLNTSKDATPVAQVRSTKTTGKGHTVKTRDSK